MRLLLCSFLALLAVFGVIYLYKEVKAKVEIEQLNRLWDR
jgi:hypothetical protein